MRASQICENLWVKYIFRQINLERKLNSSGDKDLFAYANIVTRNGTEEDAGGIQEGRIQESICCPVYVRTKR